MSGDGSNGSRDGANEYYESVVVAEHTEEQEEKGIHRPGKDAKQAVEAEEVKVPGLYLMIIGKECQSQPSMWSDV